MRVERRRRHDGSDIHDLPAILLVDMQMQAIVRLCEALEEQGLLAPAHRVVQTPVASQGLKPVDHAVDRCQPDAAGDEHGCRRSLVQGEIVARQADLQHAADSHLLVQAA